ncbi:MAG: efflux transporter outer membrane subunit [Woeseiaceae bacterium]|nr:efflux transporter outer membrane subunit [Woeseiaceae bacterium]
MAETTRRRIAALLVLGVAAMSAGCVTVGPDFETPEAQLDPDWIEGSNSEVNQSASPDPAWWNVFGDPELNALIERAYEQNLTLQAAGLRIYEARAILGVVAGSLYPQSQNVTASAGSRRLSPNAPPVSGLPDDVRSRFGSSRDVYQVGFDAAWELDFWGRFRRGVEAAEANLAASVANFDNVLVMLTGEVAATYVTLRTLEQRLAVARDNVDNQERGLEMAQIRFDGGVTTELDVHQASALLNATRASVAGLQAERRRAQNALAVLLGTTPQQVQDTLSGPGVIPATPDEVVVGMPAELLRRRPDIVRAEMDAAAQSARIGIAKADMYPAFVLGGTIGLSSGTTSDLFESQSRYGSSFVAINLPIFNYGRLKNRARAEDARFEAAVALYRNTVLSAAREVEDALIGFVKAREQSEHLGKSVEDARAAVRLAEIMYQEGAVDYTRVLTAQLGLLESQDQYTRSKGSVAFNLVAAYKALGGGWAIRLGNPVIPAETREAMQERTGWGDLLEDDQTEAPDERGRWRAPDW